MSVAQKQKAAWGGKEINSIERVMQALDYLDMPNPKQEAISMIAVSQEKEKFKSAIEESLQNGQQTSLETKRYLFGLVSCISGTFFQCLNQLGYDDIPIEAMIQIGKTNGMEFRGAVNAAIIPKDPNHHKSVQFVRATLQAACDHVGARLTAPHNRLCSVESRTTEQTAQSNQDAERPIENSGEDDNGFLSTHVYGSSAALCFNIALSKNNENHTIILDAALSPTKRKADWQNAIKFQIGHKELTILYAVLNGWHHSLKFVHETKSFELERQEGNLFAKVNDRGNSQRSVPIGPQDACQIGFVVFSQIMKNVPKVLQNHPDIVHHMMRQTLVIKSVPSS